MPFVGSSNSSSSRCPAIHFANTTFCWLPPESCLTGIDIAAKHLIHRYIEAFAAKGGSVVLSSTDLPELLGLSDQVVVMRQGAYVGSMRKDDANAPFGEQKLRNLLGIG